MRLDPTTVTIMVGLLALLCMTFLLIVRMFFPRTVRGLNSWLIGSTLLVVGSLFHGIKEVTGSTLLILLANSFVIAGILLFWIGLQRFYQKPPLPRSFLWALLIAVAVLIAWFTWGHDSFQARLVAMTVVQMGLFTAITLYLQGNSHKGFGHWLIVIAYSLAAFVSLARFLTVLFAQDQLNTLLGVSLVQILYLTSFSFTWLLSTMGFIVLIIEDLQSQLVYLARHDVLTGVLNRGAFFAEAKQRFETGRRRGQTVTVFLLDLDHFKRINDQHGHQQGDRVLVSFCQHARQALGPEVLFGRYGGEEFVALLVGVSDSQASLLAERVRVAVSRGLLDMAVTVSVGMASDPEAATIDELLGHADEALYAAKKSGRDRVVLAA